jgi:hypothetical protein
MAEVLTDKEQEIVELVIRALPRHLVVVKPVKVFTVEEGESSNLRFTAHDGSFTDLNRDRIATEEETAVVLAKEVEAALLEQLEEVPG